MSLTTPSTTSESPPRHTVPLTLLVVAILVSAGVAVAATAVYFELVPPKSTSTGPTVTVVDDLGRTLVVPLNPTRIVVLAPSVMDIVYRLGLRDRVVGVGCDAGIPGGLLNEYSPNQSSLWGVTAGLCISDYPSLSIDELLNASPQLVLATTITSAADVEQISVTYDIPVVILSPTTVQGIVSDVQLVGTIFPSVSATTDTLVSTLNQELVNASNFDTNLSYNGVPLPTVLLTYYYDSGGYYTYGPDSFGQSLIDTLGATNVAGAAPLVYLELNGSAVLNDSPQVILYGTSWNDVWLVENETPAQWASSSSGAPYWAQLTGSKIALDVTLLSEPDPTMILALPLLLHCVHPTLVPPP
ncbi:MAG: ABC transporter substrate-binding protein [Thermoplasmata archaeon]